MHPGLGLRGLRLPPRQHSPARLFFAHAQVKYHLRAEPEGPHYSLCNAATASGKSTSVSAGWQRNCAM